MDLSLFERDANDPAKAREAGYTGDLGSEVADYVRNRRVHAERILALTFGELTRSEKGVFDKFRDQREDNTSYDSPANQKLLKQLIEDYCM